MLNVQLNVDCLAQHCNQHMRFSIAAASSKGSDEHAHPHSLVRAFPSHTSKIDLIADVELGARSKGSDGPAHPHSLARAFPSPTHKEIADV